MLPLRVDQDAVLKKISLYLRQEGREQDLIEQFSRGYCSGISTLWLYSKWLQTQPKTSEKPRDDYAWFKSTVEFIAGWDGQWAVNEQEKQEQKDRFERFISYIQYFQHIIEYLPIAQGDIDKILEDTKGRKPRREYSIAALLTLEQLKNLLNEEDIVKTRKLILITSHKHDTALFKEKESGNYFYFNPSDPKGEVQTISADELAILIFIAFGFDPNKSSPIGMRMFSLDEKIEIYPPQEEVLNRILGLTLIGESGYADGSSGLMQAAKIGCLASVKYYLAKQVDPNLADDDGWTALMLAADMGHDEIVKVLLENKYSNFKVNPNLANKIGLTALMIAAEKDHAEVVKVLLESKYPNPEINLDLVDEYGWSALMYAADGGNAEIVTLLLAKGANLNLVDNKNQSALMVAAARGYPEVVKLLLDKGAKSELVDYKGRTALRFAREMEKDEVIKIFEEKTAAGLLAKRLGGVLSQLPKETPVQQSKIFEDIEKEKSHPVK